MNREWHQQHVMGRNATLDDRIAWHQAHALACSCRAMPASIEAEIAARGAAAVAAGEDAPPAVPPGPARR
jgi:hypothetical protein